MQVQKLDPAIPPLGTFKAEVEVVNEDGPRYQLVTVRAPEDVESVGEEAKKAAQRLGFIPTGNVKFV